ncbi:(4Fe-4S)-binding protein [Paenibacillus taichungensis]
MKLKKNSRKDFCSFRRMDLWSFYKLKSERCEEVMSKEKVYYGKNIEVMFNSEVCIHSGICVKGLPEVFDLSKRPWVNPDADTTEAITRHIDTCPSGALTYKRLDGEYSTEKEG